MNCIIEVDDEIEEREQKNKIKVIIQYSALMITNKQLQTYRCD